MNRPTEIAQNAELERGLPARPTGSTILLLAAATLCLTVGLPTDATASGFYLPGRGVQPMGRGGAYVASGEGNLNSVWYNPANLATLEGTELMVDTAVIGTFSQFHRSSRYTQGGRLVDYPSVHNQSLPRPDPPILIYASGLKFPERGPQRYTLINNDKSLIAFLGGSVAYEINDDLRVGAGLYDMVAHFELVNTTSSYTGVYGRPEDRDLDILTKIAFQDFFNPTGNLGLWWEPVDKFQTAFSVQLPGLVRDKSAKMEVRMPSHPLYDQGELSNDTVSGALRFPWVLRAALRWDDDNFDVELAGVWEGWGVFDRITVSPNNIRHTGIPGVGAIPIGPLNIPQKWQNTFSVRAGGDWRVSDPLTLRAGYIFETGAPPDEFYSVFAPDADKHVFSGGFSYEWSDFTLDVSAAYYALNNKQITNSQMRQINPIDTEDELATVIGNGGYKTSNLIVGTGITYNF